MFAAFIHDTRYALRALLRQPLFAALAVVSLGVGLGVNTAIYSLFDQAVLRPLPVSQPRELVNLVASGIKRGSTSTSRAGAREAVFSYAMFRDLQQAATRAKMFTGLAAHRSFTTNISFGDRTFSGTGMLVSGNYFGVLELKPALGRLLLTQDDVAPGAGRVVVLGYDYWRNHLGGDPAVVGRELSVNGESLLVVGVAPAGFTGTTFGTEPQIFTPISLRWLLQPTMPEDSSNRRSYWVYLFGRLAPDVAAPRARDALNSTYAGLLRDVELPLEPALNDSEKTTFLGGRIAFEPGKRGQSTMSSDLRAPLLLLLASAGLVLLVACINLANLLLARGIGRAPELALRVSLGASGGRISRQLLTESLLLAAGGLLLAVPVALATMRALVAVMPYGGAFIAGLALEPAAVVFASLLALAALLVFGALPARHAASLSPALTLRGASAQTTGSRTASRLRASLVVLQTALSMATLATAGLFMQSLYHLRHEPLGVDAQSIAGMSIYPGRSGYTPERANQLFDRLDQQLAAMPGAETASYSQVQLFSNDIWQTSVRVEGVAPASDPAYPIFNTVGETYFRTLGIPLLAGRTFTHGDDASSSRVAIVSRSFARLFGLGDNPLGRHISFDEEGPLDIEIVGMVADSKMTGVRADEPAQVYLPRQQGMQITDGSYYVRTSGDPGAMLAMMRATVAALDPQLPVENLRPLPETIGESIQVERFVGALTASFAVLATALAALGLFGVMTYALNRRRRELGLRLALGAAPKGLARMLLAQMGRLGAIGMASGLVLAIAFGRIAQSLLFGVRGSDPMTLISAAALLVAVGTAALAIPALRIRHIDPAKVLREE